MKQNKSSRDWSFRIKDILHAINKIEHYTKDMTLSQFKKNELVVDAVIRNFEIIGEASNNVPLVIQRAHPSIPWRQMIALRNVLIHEYFGVDLNTVWQTAYTYLPPLKQPLQSLIEKTI
ncbi:MAG: DUF86 domain-containing protein [Chlamydiales bacterium]